MCGKYKYTMIYIILYQSTIRCEYIRYSEDILLCSPKLFKFVVKLSLSS